MNRPWESEFAGRVVTLCTGQAGLRSALPVTVTGTDQRDGEPVIDFQASDNTLDRAGEILLARGWRLENYRKNPVFQNAHNYGNIIFTLGRALITEVRGEHLFQRVLFATGINPMARLAYDMYRAMVTGLLATNFNARLLCPVVDAMAAVIRPALDEDRMVVLSQFEASLSATNLLGTALGDSPGLLGRRRGGGVGRLQPALKAFIIQRAGSVQDQLEGKLEGYVPRELMRGFNGPGLDAPPPRPL